MINIPWTGFKGSNTDVYILISQRVSRFKIFGHFMLLRETFESKETGGIFRIHIDDSNMRSPFWVIYDVYGYKVEFNNVALARVQYSGVEYWAIRLPKGSYTAEEIIAFDGTVTDIPGYVTWKAVESSLVTVRDYKTWLGYNADYTLPFDPANPDNITNPDTPGLPSYPDVPGGGTGGSGGEGGGGTGSGQMNEKDPIYINSPAYNITQDQIDDFHEPLSLESDIANGLYLLPNQVLGISLATCSTAGAMSPEDKCKLDNLDDQFYPMDDNPAGYLTRETDPIFTASPSYRIQNSDIARWNDAYYWGNHADQGYLQDFFEEDPVFTGSPAFGITEEDIENWNKAYTRTPVLNHYDSASTMIGDQSNQVDYFIYHVADTNLYYEKLSTSTGSISDYNLISGLQYIHPVYTPIDITLSGAQVFSEIIVDDIGSVTHVGSRNLTTSDIGAININQKGAPGGVPDLDTSGKVPISQLPDSVTSGLQYKGLWDAFNNTPTLPDPTTANGWFYIVEVPGTQFGNNYEVGDWAISDGVKWDIVKNTQFVTSVFGRLGAVVASAEDYTNYYVRHDINTQGLSSTNQQNARTNINAQITITGGASTITTADLTPDRALISNATGKVVVSPITALELSYLDNVTSNIQDQLNTKISSNQTITLTGPVTGSGTTTIATSITDDAIVTSKILNSNVTYAKIQNVTGNRVLGRMTTSGVVQELTSTDLKTFVNYNLQEVTDNGSVTTRSITTGGIINNSTYLQTVSGWTMNGRGWVLNFPNDTHSNVSFTIKNTRTPNPGGMFMTERGSTVIRAYGDSVTDYYIIRLQGSVLTQATVFEVGNYGRTIIGLDGSTEAMNLLTVHGRVNHENAITDDESATLGQVKGLISGGAYVHPAYTPINQTLTGSTVLSGFTTDSIGSVTSFSTRSMLPSDIGAEPAITKGSLVQGGAITLSGSLTDRLIGVGSVTVSHTDTSSQTSIVNTNGNIIQSVSLDTYGHVTTLGSYNGDDRWTRRHVLIDNQSNWLYTSETGSYPGVHVGHVTTGSANFPSTLGQFAIFGGNQTNAASYYSRVFGFFREYDRTNVYIGTANDDGTNNGWALIYTSYNLNLSTLGGVPSTRTLTIQGQTYDLSADRVFTPITVGAGLLYDTGHVIRLGEIIDNSKRYVSLNNFSETGFGVYGTVDGSPTISMRSDMRKGISENAGIYNQIINSASNKDVSFNLSKVGSDDYEIRLQKTINPSVTQELLFSSTGKIIFTDSLNNAGVEYAGDYEPNFTDRSLITKKYADNLVAFCENLDDVMEVDSWGTASSPVAFYLQNLTYGSGLYFATSQTTPKILRSSNDMNWTIVGTLPSGGGYVKGLAFGDAILSAIFSSGTTRIYRSIDYGVTWMGAATSELNAIAWTDVCFNDHKFIIVSSTGHIATSADGAAWNLIRYSTTAAFSRIFFGGGLYVIMGTISGVQKMLTSPDAITWTEQTPPSNRTWYNGIYAFNQFTFVTSTVTDFKIVNTTDFVTWTDVSYPPGRDIDYQEFSYGNGILVLVGFTGGGVARNIRSLDGTTWDIIPDLTTFIANSTIFGGDKFIVTGSISTTYSFKYLDMNSCGNSLQVGDGLHTEGPKIILGDDYLIYEPDSGLKYVEDNSSKWSDYSLTTKKYVDDLVESTELELGNYVSYTQDQTSKTETERQQARDNVDVYSITQINTITGDLNDLNTEDKSNLVSGINQANSWKQISW